MNLALIIIVAEY